MKKIISTLAIAGLGAGLAVGAQAQTSLGTSTGLYDLSVSAPVVSTISSGLYMYSYTATLLTTTPGLNINSFVIGSIGGTPVAGYTPTVVNNPFTDFTGTLNGTTATYTAFTGFEQAGDSVTFNVESTLPTPTGTVQLTSNGTASSASTDQGPGAVTAVPEAGSFALLGLGLLPLGLIARRRMARSN